MKAIKKISNRLSAGCFLFRGITEASTCHDRKEFFFDEIVRNNGEWNSKWIMYYNLVMRRFL